MANLIHSNQIQYPLSGSFSGSLQGTASNAISSSFASTASYYGGSVTSASYAATASYVVNAQTASYVLNAISSSYAATASYYSGSVSNATSASYAVSSSYSATSNYAGSSSFAISASYSSTASYVLNALSASYASTASYYGGSVTSASYATTASYTNGGVTGNGAATQIGYFNGLNSITGSNNLVFSGSNVGIGTSTPTANTATRRALVVSDTVNDVTIRLEGSSSIVAEVFTTGTVAGIGTRSATQFNLISNNVNRIGVDSSGNILLGDVTNATATHRLTFQSGNTGTANYNTVDQTTNYQRFRQYWSGNTFYNTSENAGTASNATSLFGARSGLNNITFNFTLTGGTTSNNAVISLTPGATSWNTALYSGTTYKPIILINGSVTGTSGNHQYLQLAPTFNTSGTTGFSTYRITPYLQATGSGASYLLDIGTNTAADGLGTHTSLFTVDVAGNAVITGSLSVTGSHTLIGNKTLIGSLSTSGSVTVIGSETISGSLIVTQGITGSLSGSAISAISASYATTASYIQAAQTASYVLNAVSSSYATTASYALNGGGGSAFPYSGSAVITGSLLITGSGLTVTGSVQVAGNSIIAGYSEYLPVNTNINQAVSASYIYVSGSTNDLYFTQNGQGYGNTTRLRWLESVLYTGILNGGILSSTPGSTTFTITSGSGLIVTLNASTASSPYPTVKNISWNTQTLPITYSGSAKITYVGIDNTGAVIQQTTPWGALDINQWDNSIAIGVVLTLSGSVSTGVFNSPQIAYGPAQKTDDFFRAFGPLKISGHTLIASGSTMSIVKSAGSSYREGANYAINPNHPSTVVENSINTSKIYRYYLSGSTPVIDTGIGAAGYTVIDPTKYVDTTTGQLATVPTNGANLKYTIQRVFWIPNSPTNAFIVYYGSTLYSSLIDAQNGIGTEPFTEAPNTAANAIQIGYIIVAGNATDLTNASKASIVQAGLFRNVGGIGSSGTNFVSATLAGLSDVSISSPTAGDMLIYGNTSTWNNTKQLTGSYTITGSLSVGPSTITTATVTSTVGSSTVFTQATGSYTSAFYKYTFTSQSNARAGEIMAIWNGTSVQFTDNSTPDIGNTSAVTSSVSISGANVILSTYTPTTGWTLKSQVTYI